MAALQSMTFYMLLFLQISELASSRDCDADEYQCVSGGCIPEEKRCDGIRDCYDVSDELNCAPKRCQENETQCRNYQQMCIPFTEKCDGVSHCPDWTDEERCPPKTCLGNEIRCRNYQHICKPITKMCDRYPDCPDWTDEQLNCRCDADEYQCVSGGCIPEEKRCDGIRDCYDVSDELNCAPKTCRENETRCSNYQQMCIPFAEKCDGFSHCPDWTDEERCPPKTCRENEIQCHNYQQMCKPITKKCDGYPDCPDWSDEEHCHCDADEYQCLSGVCIPKEKRCDGILDCYDISDELDCDCGADEFECPLKGCIPKEKRCDGILDCYNFSDELSCAPKTCRENEIRCHNYQQMCKPISKKCDGYPDCPDLSDEDHCLPERCQENETQCRNYQHMCISIAEKCDGYPNCPDWSDEEHCPPKTCRGNEIRCRNYQHICKPIIAKCDGHPDCPDWTDEDHCPLRNCTGTEFQCLSGKCLTDSRKCNNFNDCGDWSDELSCPSGDCVSDFKCPRDGRCVSHSYVCNGQNDCGDWSDEERCHNMDQNCGNGWKYHKGHCYKVEVLEENTSWLEARRQCSDAEAKLTSVILPHDEEFLISILPNDSKPAYIGLKKDFTRTKRNDVFRWDNGLPLIYQNWHGQEPNGGTLEQCVMLDGVDGWKDVFCGQNLTNQFICQKDYPITWLWLVLFRTTLPLRAPTVKYATLGECKTGELSSKFKFCDGQTDCTDGSDEMECDGSCDETKYRCSNSACISLTFYCDGIDDCGDGSDEETCIPKPCSESEWTCHSSQCIDASKRCDFKSDCTDNSDEIGCYESGSQTCRGFACYDGSCLPKSWEGDGQIDCDGYEGEDEKVGPMETGKRRVQNSSNCRYEPDVFGKSYFHFSETDDDCYTVVCTGEYYKCPFSYCIPISLVCDGHQDCRNGEDEEKCYALSCRGYYRCTGESNCIHPNQVCDGVLNCPKGDDERYCPLPCPPSCTCYGRIVTCDLFTSSTSIPGDVRKLDISGVDLHSLKNHNHPDQGMNAARESNYYGVDSQVTRDLNVSGEHTHVLTEINSEKEYVQSLKKRSNSIMNDQEKPLRFSDFHFLAVLILSDCQITDITGLFGRRVPSHLIELDLSHNKIKTILKTTLHSLTQLKYLDLSNNFFLTNIENGAFSELKYLQKLNLRNTKVGVLSDNTFSGLFNLRMLDLSGSSVMEIRNKPFYSMKLLKELDIQQNNIEQFSCCFLKDLKHLEKLFAPTSQFCCDSMRPDNLKPENCITSDTEAIASCKDLLGTKAVRAILWLIAMFALGGNIIVLVYRFKYDRQSLKLSYGVFVANLSISDCLMGLYMLIIGGADSYYRGTYVSGEYEWRHGSVCKFAGFLSTVSSEASCILISIITLDRFLAIKFPFGQVKFTRKTTFVSILVTWIIAIILAAIPLLPHLEHWEFYTRNSVCVALPLSANTYPGWQYSTFIFVGFNTVLFAFIWIGQVMIFRELKSGPRIEGSGSSDKKVAIRLFLVVLTDFMCWCPVGVMGILVLNGYHIDEEVYAWTAVAVLPINSALNPFLYTIPGMIDSWRRSVKQQEIDEPTPPVYNPPDHPAVLQTRKYVGKPEKDMKTLRATLDSPDMTNDAKCALLALIVIYLYELRHQDRRFEAVTDEKIFVSKSGKEITTICLSLRKNPYRYWLVDDVCYLCTLIGKDREGVPTDHPLRKRNVDSHATRMTTDVGAGVDPTLGMREMDVKVHPTQLSKDEKVINFLSSRDEAASKHDKCPRSSTF